MYQVTYTEPNFRMTSNRFFIDLDKALSFYRSVCSFNYRCVFVEVVK